MAHKKASIKLAFFLANGSHHCTNTRPPTTLAGYCNKGLPPGPISVPGRASLDAALHPADGAWLYYVVTGDDGSHSFATTFAEHRRNIALAKARGLR